MLIREIRVDDSENLINLIKEVESAADFMLMGPGERKTTPAQLRKQIEGLKQRENSTILVAEVEEKLAGYLFAIGGSVKKNKHSAYIVIGLLEVHRGKGIGTALFEFVENWARPHAVSRLELTVVTENAAGIALYKKSGFEVEGTKRNSLLINGVFYNEFYMSKLI